MRFITVIATLAALAGCAEIDTEQEGGDDTGMSSVEVGDALYAAHCAGCHGGNARGSADGPNLLRELHHTDDELVAWILYGKGEDMPAFASELTEADSLAIVDWLRE